MNLFAVDNGRDLQWEYVGEALRVVSIGLLFENANFA